MSVELETDFVLVFDVKLSDKTASAAAACESQYTQLIQRLKQTGLDATSRPGGKGTNEILIFVRCPQAKLRAEMERERISDWLHGVFSTKPDPRSRRDFAKVPLTPSERLRLTYRLITGPLTPTRRAETACAGVVPLHESFTRVKSIFTPHNPTFNKEWLGRWTSFSHVMGIPIEELDMIKDNLGEAIAYYFEFLRYYFFALSVPSVVGFITWFAGKDFNVAYSMLLMLWSVIFVEGWSLREKRLAVRWGTFGSSDVCGTRTDFKPDHVEENQPQYTWWKQELRIVTSVPILLAFAAILGFFISIFYAVEVFINESYSGPGKQFLGLVPTILFAGVVPQVCSLCSLALKEVFQDLQIVGLWHKLAIRLTTWENHAHTASFDKSLTLKLFSVNSVVSFGALTLTAYVYVPFGALIMPHIQEFMHTHVPLISKAHMASSQLASSTFSVNADRLRNTLFALLTTTQAVGAIVENFLPLITRYVFKSVAEVQEKREKKNGGEKSAVDEADEHAFLDRVRHEASLPAYDLFVDYAEMAVQFGYVALWSAVWPLAPVMAFINDFFELRGDAFKMTVNVRRPIPARAETLGPWLDVFGFITWLAALTNSSLIYLYRPHPDHSCGIGSELVGAARTVLNATASALNATSLEQKPLSPREVAYKTSNVHCATEHASGKDTFASIRSVLFSACLVALACEHGYVLMRFAVRHILERGIWRGTPEEKALRHSEERLKVQYMEGMGLSIPDTPALSAANSDLPKAFGQEVGSQFWSRPDQGADEIRRQIKQE